MEKIFIFVFSCALILCLQAIFNEMKKRRIAKPISSERYMQLVLEGSKNTNADTKKKLLKNYGVPDKPGVRMAMAYMETILEKPIETQPMVGISPMDLVEIFWPLNEIFQPRLQEIKKLEYKKWVETAADVAIKKFSESPLPSTWQDLNDSVWRVLYERHTQLMLVAMINEANGIKVILHIPEDLPIENRLPSMMLYWLHSMKLPYSIKDYSNE